MIADEAKRLFKAAQKKYTFDQTGQIEIIFIAEAARLIERCTQIESKHVAEAVNYATWENCEDYPSVQLQVVTHVTERNSGEAAPVAKRASLILAIVNALRETCKVNAEYVATNILND